MINPACWRTPATWRARRASLTPSALFHLPIDLLPAIVCKGPNYVWQFSCDKLHKVSAFWLVGLKEETVSHICGNLITSQGVDIDFFFWMTLINCFSLRYRTTKHLKAKLMSQPKIRQSLIQCHVFYCFIFQGSKTMKNMTGYCEIGSFNKLNDVSGHSEKRGVRVRKQNRLKLRHISVELPTETEKTLCRD